MAGNLEVWASPELLGPPGNQLDTSWGHLDAPEAQKTTRLDRKMLQVIIVIQASSRALRPLFWSSGLPLSSWDLLGPRSTSLGHLDAPEAQKTTRLDRKMPQSGNRHPGIFQSSQATVLELSAFPELLGPPWTQLGTSLSLGKLENSMNIHEHT